MWKKLNPIAPHRPAGPHQFQKALTWLRSNAHNSIFFKRGTNHIHPLFSFLVYPLFIHLDRKKKKITEYFSPTFKALRFQRLFSLSFFLSLTSFSTSLCRKTGESTAQIKERVSKRVPDPSDLALSFFPVGTDSRSLGLHSVSSSFNFSKSLSFIFFFVSLKNSKQDFDIFVVLFWFS